VAKKQPQARQGRRRERRTVDPPPETTTTNRVGTTPPLPAEATPVGDFASVAGVELAWKLIDQNRRGAIPSESDCGPVPRADGLWVQAGTYLGRTTLAPVARRDQSDGWLEIQLLTPERFLRRAVWELRTRFLVVAGGRARAMSLTPARIAATAQRAILEELEADQHMLLEGDEIPRHRDTADAIVLDEVAVGDAMLVALINGRGSPPWDAVSSIRTRAPILLDLGRVQARRDAEHLHAVAEIQGRWEKQHGAVIYVYGRTKRLLARPRPRAGGEMAGSNRQGEDQGNAIEFVRAYGKASVVERAKEVLAVYAGAEIVARTWDRTRERFGDDLRNAPARSYAPMLFGDAIADAFRAREDLDFRLRDAARSGHVSQWEYDQARARLSSRRRPASAMDIASHVRRALQTSSLWPRPRASAPLTLPSLDVLVLDSVRDVLAEDVESGFAYGLDPAHRVSLVEWIEKRRRKLEESGLRDLDSPTSQAARMRDELVRDAMDCFAPAGRRTRGDYRPRLDRAFVKDIGRALGLPDGSYRARGSNGRDVRLFELVARIVARRRKLRMRSALILVRSTLSRERSGAQGLAFVSRGT
jgi:hypothetical protein